MQKTGIFDSLIYLDKEYVSAKYEEVAGYTPDTLITKAEGLNAGIRIPILSAGASSIESKSYKLSTSAMLSAIMGELSKLNEFSSSDHALGQRSKIAWVTGNFFVSQVKVTRTKHNVTIIGKPKEIDGITKEQVAEENYFKISVSDEVNFALITAPDYFSSGIDSFRNLLGSVVHLVDMPVRALLRIYPSKSAFEEWLATPLIIIEDDR